MSSGNFIGDAGQFQTPAARPQLSYDLRPLSTGEVLDRTFQVYRSRFALFAGLAVLPAAVNVVTSGIRLVYAAHLDARPHAGAGVVTAQIVSALLLLFAAVISLVLYGITQAATTWAVSSVYLGEAATIRAAYRVGFQNWIRYTVIVLRQLWAFMWLPFVILVALFAIPGIFLRHAGPEILWLTIPLFILSFLSLIYGIWAYIRISLAVPASVVESLKVRGAVRRSMQLLASRKVRIFLLLLLLLALSLVVGAIESPLMIMAMRLRGTEAFVTQSISLVVSFVAGTLIGPVGAIAICLFYFDERVRREGFDIEWMMRKVASPAAGQAELPSQGQSQGQSPEPA